MADIRRLAGNKRSKQSPLREGRVLVVDDEPLVLDALADEIKSLGYEVTPYANPMRAFESFDPGAYDVAVLDVRMDPISGIELYRRIAALASWFPMVIHSAYIGDDVSLEQIRQLNPAGILSKLGCTPQELHTTLTNAIMRGRAIKQIAEQNEQLRDLNANLEERVRQQASQLVQAEKMAGLATFAAGVFHHLKNKLVPGSSGSGRLKELFQEVSNATRSLHSLGLTPGEYATLDGIVEYTKNRVTTQELEKTIDERVEQYENCLSSFNSQTGSEIPLATASRLAELMICEGHFMETLRIQAEHCSAPVTDYVAASLEFYQQVSMIKMSIGEITSIVQDVLLFSKPGNPNLSRIELSEYMNRKISIMLGRKPKGDVKVDCDYQEGLDVYMDEKDLDQVVVNLLLNSLEAIKRDGKIRVRTYALAKEEKDYAYLEVSDNGVGIPAEDYSRIFEPFYTTKGAKGTGLGLAVTYGLVRSYGGEISFKSKVSEGTVFTVKLPRRRELEGWNDRQID